MGPNRATIRHLLIGASFGVVFACGACGPQSTDPDSLDTARTTPGTRPTRFEGAPPTMRELSTDARAVDRHDPAAVAGAFVDVVTNRRPEELSSTWRLRAILWASPGVVASLED